MEGNRFNRSDGRTSAPRAGGSAAAAAAQDSEETLECLSVEDHQMLLQHLHINLPEGALTLEINQRATRPDVIKDCEGIVEALRKGRLTVVQKPRLSCVKVKQASKLRQGGKMKEFLQLLFFKRRTKESEKSLKDLWETSASQSGCRFRMRDTLFTETPVLSPQKLTRSSEAWKASFGNPEDNRRNEEDCFKFFLRQKGLETKDLKHQRERRVESGFISGRVDYLIEVEGSGEDTETSGSQRIIVECKGTKGNMVDSVFSLSPDGDEAEFNTHHEYYHQTQAYLHILRQEGNPSPVTAFMVVKVSQTHTQSKFYCGEVTDDTGNIEELNHFCQEEALPRFLSVLNLIFQKVTDRQDRVEERDRQDGMEERDRQEGMEKRDRKDGDGGERQTGGDRGETQTGQDGGETQTGCIGGERQTGGDRGERHTEQDGGERQTGGIQIFLFEDLNPIESDSHDSF